MALICSPESIPLRTCRTCTRGRGVCNGETVVISTPVAREAYIRCAPVTLNGNSEDQARKFYDCLPQLLRRVGAMMDDVVLERVFFRDLQADFGAFQRARRDAYEAAGIPAERQPAASYIEQPPCRAEQAFELQVYVVAPTVSRGTVIRSLPESEGGVTAKEVEIDGCRHLYLMNLDGRGPDGKLPDSFRQQSDAMFATAADLLGRHGTEFSKVLRTWCYLDLIDRDYDEFNASRNVFFEQHGIHRLPASTGIRAGLYPSGKLCGMDLYALLDPEKARIEVMHTPTLNEAPEYGSAFSRGMKVSLPDKTLLFISGTASVDEAGATVHVGDIRKQIERMLVNVRELLQPHGATFSDLAQAITYLKSRRNVDLFLDIWKKWGLLGLPNTFVEAGVCRPDLLCELEAIAIIPADRVSADNGGPV